MRPARLAAAAPTEVQLAASDIEAPSAVTLDSHGDLYALVYGRCGLYNSIVKLSPRGTVFERLEFTYGTAPGQFKGITGVAVDAAGNIYATDFLNSRVQKLSPSGRPLAVWTGRTNGGPGIHYPTGLTLDQQGNIYVVDKNASRIVVLSPGGKVIGGLSTGYAPEYPESPRDFVGIVGLGLALAQPATGIAVHGSTVYVATGIDLRKLSPTGALLAVWKPPLGNTGYKLAPSQAAVAPNGDIYTSGGAAPMSTQSKNGGGGFGVVDLAGVIKLSPTGSELASWLQRGWAPGQFAVPTGVTVDAAGDVYVADEGMSRIQKLAPDGTPLAIWGDTRTTAPPRSRFGGAVAQLTVAPSGRIFALSAFRERLEEVSSHGTIIASWKPRAPGVPFSAAGLSADAAGNIYLADRRYGGVVELDARGRLLHHWTLPLPRNPIRIGGFIERPQVQDVAVGPPGTIYAIVDSGLWALNRATGKWRSLVKGSSSSDARYNLSAIAVDPRGRIYALNTNRRQQVDVFSLAGKLLGTRTASEACAGDSFMPVGIAVGPGGNLLVADGSPAQRILKFSPSGRLLARWGSRGRGAGQFLFPFDAAIAVGKRGNIFVGDETGRVQKFSPSGRLLAVWR